jgi:hypothetical protein
MARIIQLDPVAGAVIDPADQLLVEHSGDIAHRASQVQVRRGLLQQTHDPAISYPAGSFGAVFLAGAAGAAGTIDSLTTSPGPIVETGATVNSPQLAWTLSAMTVVSQGLSGPLTAGVTLTPSQRSVILGGNVTTNSTWVLTVTSSGGVVTRSVTLSFGHYLHYGRGPAATLNSAAILALTGSRLGLDPDGDFSFSAGTDPNAYWWFCYPDSWGTQQFLDVGTGLIMATFDAGTVSVTNASGHARAFRCIRSLNALHSAMIMRVS